MNDIISIKALRMSAWLKENVGPLDDGQFELLNTLCLNNYREYCKKIGGFNSKIQKGTEGNKV